MDLLAEGTLLDWGAVAVFCALTRAPLKLPRLQDQNNFQLTAQLTAVFDQHLTMIGKAV